jgi:hypothetical protein
VLIQD